MLPAQADHLQTKGHEQEDFSRAPNFGVNGLRTDPFTSLFLRDVTNATGVASFGAIAGEQMRHFKEV